MELELNMSRKRECGSERKLCPENGSAVLKGTLLLEQDSRFGNILLGTSVVYLLLYDAVVSAGQIRSPLHDLDTACSSIGSRLQ